MNPYQKQKIGFYNVPLQDYCSSTIWHTASSKYLSVKKANFVTFERNGLAKNVNITKNENNIWTNNLFFFPLIYDCVCHKPTSAVVKVPSYPLFGLVRTECVRLS